MIILELYDDGLPDRVSQMACVFQRLGFETKGAPVCTKESTGVWWWSQVLVRKHPISALYPPITISLKIDSKDPFTIYA